jgi:hypothetical protein
VKACLKGLVAVVGIQEPVGEGGAQRERSATVRAILLHELGHGLQRGICQELSPAHNSMLLNKSVEICQRKGLPFMLTSPK